MRVANIIEEGKLGGPQVRMVMVAAALYGRVHTTVIMPAENSEDFRKRCDANGVTYKILPITRITKELRVALRYLIFSLPEIIGIASYLKRDNFDLVHVSGGSWQFKGAIAGKLAGKKVLWHLNDTAMPWFIRRLFAMVSRCADGYIFASVRSKEYYMPLINASKPMYVIPAPVNTEAFNPSNEYIGEQSLIAGLTGKIVIGTIANINPIKGLETFIRAASELNKKTNRIQFVVVGPVYKNQKRYFNALRRLCERLGVDNIDFVGGRTDVRPLLSRFDAYVCSSIAESSPISVWEAMAMGKPVVSTDVGDVSLYVRDGFNGFIVNIDDSISLASRLYELVEDTDLRHRFGCRSRDIVVGELGLGQCVERHIHAYSSVMRPLSS